MSSLSLIVDKLSEVLTLLAQYMPLKKKMALKLKIGDHEIVEEGEVFAEATFISET